MEELCAGGKAFRSDGELDGGNDFRSKKPSTRDNEVGDNEEADL